MKNELKAQATTIIATKKTSVNTTVPTTGTGHVPPIAEKDELRYFDDVVLRARTGDRAALASVAVYLRPVLVRQAQKMMGPYALDAEDVVHDVFVQLAEGASAPIPEGTAPAAWLVSVVRDGAREYRRERDREWGWEWGNDGDGPG
jgi:hypothetical protein